MRHRIQGWTMWISHPRERASVPVAAAGHVEADTLLRSARRCICFLVLLVAGSTASRADDYCKSIQFQQAMLLMPQWDCGDDRAIEYGVPPKPKTNVGQIRKEDKAKQRHIDPPPVPTTPPAGNRS